MMLNADPGNPSFLLTSIRIPRCGSLPAGAPEEFAASIRFSRRERAVAVSLPRLPEGGTAPASTDAAYTRIETRVNNALLSGITATLRGPKWRED